MRAHRPAWRGPRPMASSTGATRRAVLGAAPAGAIALAAVGCGGSVEPGGTAPQVKPATIRYIHVDTGQQIWQETWAKVFANFEAKYPGVKLQVDNVPGIAQSSEKAIATGAGGEY